MSKMIVKNPTTNKYYSLEDRTLVVLPDGSDKNIISYGVVENKTIQLNLLFNKIKTVTDNGDGTQSVEVKTVAPFHVYSYISNTPQVVVYNDTALPASITASTVPFTIYDEFVEEDGSLGEVEFLCYTDNPTSKAADVTIAGNWSPLDELVGDIEIVTWTDEADSSRTLAVNGIYEHEIVRQKQGIPVKGITSIQMLNSFVPFVIQRENENTYYTYYGGQFIPIQELDEHFIRNFGILPATFNAIPINQWNVFFNGTERIYFTYLFSNRSICSNSVSSTLDQTHVIGVIYTTIFRAKTTPSVDSFYLTIEEYSLEGRLKQIEEINAANLLELQFKADSYLSGTLLEMKNLEVDTFKEDSLITIENEAGLGIKELPITSTKELENNVGYLSYSLVDKTIDIKGVVS